MAIPTGPKWDIYDVNGRKVRLPSGAGASAAGAGARLVAASVDTTDPLYAQSDPMVDQEELAGGSPVPTAGFTPPQGANAPGGSVYTKQFEAPTFANVTTGAANQPSTGQQDVPIDPERVAGQGQGPAIIAEEVASRAASPVRDASNPGALAAMISAQRGTAGGTGAMAPPGPGSEQVQQPTRPEGISDTDWRTLEMAFRQGGTELFNSVLTGIRSRTANTTQNQSGMEAAQRPIAVDGGRGAESASGTGPGTYTPPTGGTQPTGGTPPSGEAPQGPAVAAAQGTGMRWNNVSEAMATIRSMLREKNPGVDTMTDRQLMQAMAESDGNTIRIANVVQTPKGRRADAAAALEEAQVTGVISTGDLNWRNFGVASPTDYMTGSTINDQAAFDANKSAIATQVKSLYGLSDAQMEALTPSIEKMAKGETVRFSVNTISGRTTRVAEDEFANQMTADYGGFVEQSDGTKKWVPGRYASTERLQELAAANNIELTQVQADIEEVKDQRQYLRNWYLNEQTQRHRMSQIEAENEWKKIEDELDKEFKLLVLDKEQGYSERRLRLQDDLATQTALIQGLGTLGSSVILKVFDAWTKDDAGSNTVSYAGLISKGMAEADADKVMEAFAGLDGAELSGSGDQVIVNLSKVGRNFLEKSGATIKDIIEPGSIASLFGKYSGGFGSGFGGVMSGASTALGAATGAAALGLASGAVWKGASAIKDWWSGRSAKQKERRENWRTVVDEYLETLNVADRDAFIKAFTDQGFEWNDSIKDEIGAGLANGKIDADTARQGVGLNEAFENLSKSFKPRDGFSISAQGVRSLLDSGTFNKTLDQMKVAEEDQINQLWDQLAGVYRTENADFEQKVKDLAAFGMDTDIMSSNTLITTIETLTGKTGSTSEFTRAERDQVNKAFDQVSLLLYPNRDVPADLTIDDKLRALRGSVNGTPLLDVLRRYATETPSGFGEYEAGGEEDGGEDGQQADASPVTPATPSPVAGEGYTPPDVNARKTKVGYLELGLTSNWGQEFGNDLTRMAAQVKTMAQQKGWTLTDQQALEIAQGRQVEV